MSLDAIPLPLNIMPISNTKIANNALIGIGVQTINNLADQNKRANIMNELFEPARDEMIEGYEWNFAIHRQALVAKAITTEQALAYTNAFELPVDPYCLRAIRMIESDEFFKVEGRTLLTNISAVNLKYIKLVTDPVFFTPSFIAALVALLQSRSILALKKDVDAVGALFALHQELLLKAKGNDGQEGTAEDFSSTELTDVRFQTGG